MFATNSKLQGGRIVEYDGNPHAFAEQGFGVDDEATGSQRIDPHAFRVVGGSFMNSTHGDQLATPSDPSLMAEKYQPLVRDNVDGSKLQPFFSQHGETPWGETVFEAKPDDGDYQNLLKDESENYEGYDAFAQATPRQQPKPKTAAEGLLAMLQGGVGSKSTNQPSGPVSGDYNYNDDAGMMIFATDKEITAKKQKDYELQKQQQQSSNSTKGTSSRAEQRRKKKEEMIAQYNADMAFVQNWVNNLPNPVNFQIQNVDAIIDQHFGEGAAKKAAAAAAAR